MQLKEALIRYRETVSVLKKGYEQERHRIATLLRWPAVAMGIMDVSPVDVAQYRDARLAFINPRTKTTIAPATVLAELNLLSAVYGEAIKEWRVATTNPVDGVRKPRAPRGRTRRISSKEERAITRYCEGHAKSELLDVLQLGIETAMRQGEILGLTWANINLRRQIAHLPDTKNGSPRDVPLSAAALQVLQRRHASKANAVKVFSYSSSGLKSAWRTMCRRLDIKDLHFHDARHEAISRLVELGTLDIMEIAAISGHKTLAMLKRYTHLRMEKIVRKLDAAKTQASRLIQRHLVPYPVFITQANGYWIVDAPDFDGVRVSGTSRAETLRLASSTILRRLLLELRAGRRLPEPTQILTDTLDVVLIDPLGEDCIYDAV